MGIEKAKRRGVAELMERPAPVQIDVKSVSAQAAIIGLNPRNAYWALVTHPRWTYPLLECAPCGRPTGRVMSECWRGWNVLYCTECGEVTVWM